MPRNDAFAYSATFDERSDIPDLGEVNEYRPSR